MAGEESVVTQDVLRLVEAELEAELSSGPAGGIAPTDPGTDIRALREQLAVLVSTGKAEEAIGVQLAHEQVKRLSDNDFEKCTKRYVGSKRTESLIDSFIVLATKAVEMKLKIKDIDAYKKNSETTTSLIKELSNLADDLALKCGRLLAADNATLITTKHIDCNSHLPKMLKNEWYCPESPSSHISINQASIRKMVNSCSWAQGHSLWAAFRFL